MRLAALLFTLMLLSPGRGQAQDRPDPMAAYRAKTQVLKPCDRSGGGIVVCGNRAERNARQRLPLPRETDEGRIVVGDAPRASAAPVRQGACGVVGGQGAGCVGGLNAIKVIDMLGKGATLLIDPDADLASPPSLPEKFRGATPR